MSAIHNKRYSNETMTYLLTRGWTYEEKYLSIAVKIGNENAFLFLLLLGCGFQLTQKLLDKAICYNYPNIVEIIIEHSQFLIYDFGNKLISIRAFEHIFELLILKNWCKYYSEDHRKHCDKSTLVLFLIKKDYE